ncbi:hypothetical protein KJ959_08380 [bacterium]|nr:hypothetical protein [Candidatus Omnitrophota bacterium]MBU3930825.1 hypothetical protein [bacterium]MBU4123675.1 hypothetical protein [bacterium]
MSEYLRNKLGAAVKKLLTALMLSAGIVTQSFAVSATVDVTIGVRPGHNIAPDRVTDLLAATGGIEGRIELSWTAPQTEWGIKVRDYYIRWSSSSVNDAPFTGDTTAWWNASGGQDLYGWMNDPGENVNWTVNGLTPAVTYYFSIKAEDEFGNLGSFDTKTQALAQTNALAGLDSTVPGSIVNLTALTGDNEGEVKLAWTAPGDDGTSGQLAANLPPYYNSFVYEMKASAVDPALVGGVANWWSFAAAAKTVQISTAQIPGTKQTVVVTGLTPGAKLWFGIKAYDDGANWSAALNVSSATVSPDVMAPSSVTDLFVSDNSTANALTLRWTAPGDDGTAGDITGGRFRIQYSTYAIAWSSASAQVIVSSSMASGEIQTYEVGSLTGDSTYYFVVWTADDGLNWSALSNTATGWTLDNVAPAAPTGVTAIAGDAYVSLSWNANTEDDFSAYLIYRSTDNSVYTNILSTDSLSLTDTGLTNFTTYYYYLTAKDGSDNESAASAVVYAMPQPPPDVTAPTAVTDLLVSDNSTANALTLRWTAPGDDGTSGDIIGGEFRIQYSTYAAAWSLSSAQIAVSSSMAQGEIQTYEVGSLLGDSTYYFVVWTADESGRWSALSNTAAGWTLDNVAPAAPTGVTAIAGDAFVTLSWNANTEDDFSAYLIYRSTDNSVYTNILSTDSLSFTDTGLTNFTTYYYFLKAEDSYGNKSSSSAVVYAMPQTVSTDFTAPDVPGGVYGEFSADGSSFMLRWTTVTINSDGSACSDLAGYRIYRSTGIWGPFTLLYSTAATNYALARSTAQIYFYSVAAYDSAAPVNESGMSMFADTTDELNLWIVGDGAAVRIPSEIASVLRNGFDEDIIVSTDSRKSSDENYPSGRVLRSYDFETRKNISKEKVNFVFDKALAEIKIYYGVAAGGTIQSLSVNESEAARSLALVWFNGVEWVKVGGEVDTAENCVRILTDKLGSYQLRVAPRATAFSVIDGPIPKIFTPNGDNLNDVCSFYYDNPNAFAPSGEIFDIRGRKIADMKFGGMSSSVSGSLIWEGKTSSGQYAAPGVYIWQIKAEGRVYNGTVVVAR